MSVPVVTAKDRTDGLASFTPYLKLIVDEKIRLFVRKALELSPHYFWVIPASSSGRYHPPWALEKGGLTRHTKMAMYLASELSSTFELPPKERDIAIAACALHDTLKYGVDYDERYHYMHPYLPRVFYGEYWCGHKLQDMVGKPVFAAIMDAIDRHMGSVASGMWHPVGRVQPENRVEMVVHLADFTASRKLLNFQELGA